jgi:phosphatidylglycerol:prolipoprotein diacylglycerol transferase
MQLYPPDDPYLISTQIFGNPFAIRWYGVLIMSGVLIAGTIAAARARRRGLDPEHVWNMVMLGLLLGIAGARAYYVVFEWPRFAGQSWWYIINPATGGLAIHGALIGALSAVAIYSARHRLDPRVWLDIAIPTVLIGQAIGRWGNFFNQEAYGRPSDLGFGLVIDEAHRVAPFRDMVAYPRDTTLFHPTFLYESLWNLAGFGAIIALERRLADRLRPGDAAAAYAIVYGAGRLWIEGLRTDSLCTDGIGGECAAALRVAQIASIVLLLTGIAVLGWNHRPAAAATQSSAP